MRISQANVEDVGGLAHLLWVDTCDEVPATSSVKQFALELAAWWAEHHDSHQAFIAQARGPEILGMAWVALVPRVPRPEALSRLSADIQSVFVLPDHRGQGVGSALVDAATRHAVALGAARVTVHSGRRAVPMYERIGFESSRQLLLRTPAVDRRTMPPAPTDDQ